MNEYTVYLQYSIQYTCTQESTAPSRSSVGAATIDAFTSRDWSGGALESICGNTRSKEVCAPSHASVSAPYANMPNMDYSIL